MRRVLWALRIVTAASIVLLVTLYYAHGFTVQIWPDTASYLAQALGLTGAIPFERPGDRNVGYPMVLALALLTSRPAFVAVLLQAALAVLALAAIYRALVRDLIPRLEMSPESRDLAQGAVQAGLAFAALYGALHVQIASLLTEVVFAVLALAAVLVVIGCVRHVSSLPRAGHLAAAALVAALPAAVKPHWLLAGLFLELVLAAGIVRSALASPPHSWRVARTIPFASIPLLLFAIVLLPDRLLGARFSPHDQAVFGPRAAFCNHLPLIHAALAMRPGTDLQDDPAFEKAFRDRLAALVAARGGGWRLLGFNGDTCAYDADLWRLVDARFPEPAAEGRFLSSSFTWAVAHEPFPYARKVVAQVGYGFLTAFSRFAVHATPGTEAFEDIARRYPLPRSFLSGVRLEAEFGPLGTRAEFASAVLGRGAHALLAVVFHLATTLLIASALATLLLPWLRWPAWSFEKRATYVAYLALPLAVLLAHHLLIALVHTFDIWRYAFNMFFVNLFFMGAATLFCLADWRSWRTKMKWRDVASPDDVDR